MVALAILMVVLVPTVALFVQIAFRPTLAQETTALTEAWLEMETALGEDSIPLPRKYKARSLLVRRNVRAENATLLRVTVQVFRDSTAFPLIELSTVTLK